MKLEDLDADDLFALTRAGGLDAGQATRERVHSELSRKLVVAAATATAVAASTTVAKGAGASAGIGSIGLTVVKTTLAVTLVAVANLGGHGPVRSHSDTKVLQGTPMTAHSRSVPAQLHIRSAFEDSKSATPQSSNATQSGAPVVLVSPPPLDPLTRQVAMLRRADRALLEHRAPLALSVLDSFLRAFPRTPLEPEARALRALAYCAMGHASLGRSLALSVLSEQPLSPLRARLTAGCKL